MDNLALTSFVNTTKGYESQLGKHVTPDDILKEHKSIFSHNENVADTFLSATLLRRMNGSSLAPFTFCHAKFS